ERQTGICRRSYASSSVEIQGRETATAAQPWGGGPWRGAFPFTASGDRPRRSRTSVRCEPACPSKLLPFFSHKGSAPPISEGTNRQNCEKVLQRMNSPGHAHRLPRARASPAKERGGEDRERPETRQDTWRMSKRVSQSPQEGRNATDERSRSDDPDQESEDRP